MSHFCPDHPLGSVEIKRYWCGHTCQDDGVCWKYRLVYLLRHPRQAIGWIKRGAPR